jgi:hypothetical protein
MVMGYDEASALDVIARLSRDSVPPLRVSVLEWLAAAGQSAKTSDVATALDLPTTTAQRLLEDLTMLKLVGRTKAGAARNAPNTWELRQVPTWSPEFTRDVGPVPETAAPPALISPPLPPDATSRVNGEPLNEEVAGEPVVAITTPEEAQAAWDAVE